MKNSKQIALILLIGLILFGPVLSFAQNGSYNVDMGQSELNFKVSHMGPFKVKGFFSEYSGIIQFDEGMMLDLSAEVVVGSIDTDNEERDRILKTEPYFDIENYPSISFSSEGLVMEEGETFMKGILTIKETSRELKIPVTLNYLPDSDQVTIEGEIRISRKEFNLVFGSMNGLIGDKVNIELKIVTKRN